MGIDAVTLAAAKAYTNTVALGEGAVYAKGDPGESAYQVWLSLGNSGTPAQFLASLKGGDGDNGETPAFRVSGTMLQYKFPTKTPVTWTDLYSLPNSSGGSGGSGPAFDIKTYDFGGDTRNSGMFYDTKNGADFVLELDKDLADFSVNDLVNFSQNDYYKAKGLALVTEVLENGRFGFRMLSNANYFHTQLISDWYYKAPKPTSGLGLGDLYRWDQKNDLYWNQSQGNHEYKRDTIYALHTENSANGPIWAYAVVEDSGIDGPLNYLGFRIISIIVPQAWVEETPSLAVNGAEQPVMEVNIATGQRRQKASPGTLTTPKGYLLYKKSISWSGVSPADNGDPYRLTSYDASIRTGRAVGNWVLTSSQGRVTQSENNDSGSNYVSSDSDVSGFIDEVIGLGFYWYDNFPAEARYTRLNLIIEFHKNEAVS